MIQCKLCGQILGGTELNCERMSCPCKGFHELTRTWESVTGISSSIDRKNLTVGLDRFENRLRVTIAINSYIIMQTEIEMP